MRRILIDVSEFLANPLRTGIQRVVVQLCRHWPAASPPTYVKVAPSGNLVEVTPGLQPAIQEFFSSPAGSQARTDQVRRLAAEADRKGRRARIRPEDCLLAPEVFYEEKRLSYYETLPDALFRRAHFLVFDLLPLTHPEHFPVANSEHFGRYFRLIRRAKHLAFISDRTQRDCCLRLRREQSVFGPVLPLGSDSFGPRRLESRPEAPPLFLAVGTIEPRKNLDLILDALEDELTRADAPFRLAFAGRIGWAERSLIERIRELDDRCDAFSFFEDVVDEEVQRLMSLAWATFAVSEVEGFGLPAVESLWLGVPVISNREMPSVERIEQGVEKLPELSPGAIRAAVDRMLDPEYRNRKSREAAAADLATWQDFSLRCFVWVAESQLQDGI